MKTEAALVLVRTELELAKTRAVTKTVTAEVAPGVAGTVSPGGEVEYLAAENKSLKLALQLAKAVTGPDTTAAGKEGQHGWYRRSARLKEAIWVFPETGVHDTSGQPGVVRIDNHNGNPDAFSSPAHNPQHLDLGLTFLKHRGLLMGFYHLEPVEALGQKIIKGMVDHARGTFNVWEVHGENMDLHWLEGEMGEEFVKVYMRCQARLEQARTLYLGPSRVAKDGVRTPEEQRYFEVGLVFLGSSRYDEDTCRGAVVEAVGARVLRLIAAEHGLPDKWSTAPVMDEGAVTEDDLDIQCIPQAVQRGLSAAYEGALEDGNVQAIVDFEPVKHGHTYCDLCRAQGNDDRHDVSTCPMLVAARSQGDTVIVHSQMQLGGRHEPAGGDDQPQVANTNATAIDLSTSPEPAKQESAPMCIAKPPNAAPQTAPDTNALLARIAQLEREVAGRTAAVERQVAATITGGVDLRDAGALYNESTCTTAGTHPLAPTREEEEKEEKGEETENEKTKKGEENIQTSEDRAEEEKKEEKEEDEEAEGCK